MTPYNRLSDKLKQMHAILKLRGSEDGLTAETAAREFWPEKPPSAFEGRKGTGLMLAASRLLSRLVEHGYATRDISEETRITTFCPTGKDEAGQVEAGKAYMMESKHED